MSEQIRSADLLVKTALSNPSTMAQLQTNPEETLRTLLTETLLQSPRIIPDPTPPFANAVWLIVVVSFAVVMMFAAYVIGAGINVEVKTGVTYLIKGETMLTVFTTVAAFLAGLLAQSPVKSK